MADPLSHHQINKYVACRVLAKETMTCVSARESMLSEQYEQLTASTVSYKKHFSAVEAQFDLRPRLIRFGLTSINDD